MDRIFEELQRLLNARLAQAGETEAKLAKIAGCSQVHINRLKNKDGSFETLKLSTFLALFPAPVAAALAGGTPTPAASARHRCGAGLRRGDDVPDAADGCHH